MVLWASELGGNEGNHDAHSNSCVPAVLFGGVQAIFQTGRYLRGKSDDIAMDGNGYVASGLEMAQVLVSLVQYMGLTDVDGIGACGSTGPLTALYA